MRVAFDLGPISKHQQRGIGVYTQSLKKALDDKVISFTGKVPQDCDLVHFPGFSLFQIDWRYLTHKPVVVTVHDLIPLLYPQQFPLGIKAKVAWRVQRRLLKRARMVITDSRTSQKQLSALAGIKPEKIKVIYLAASSQFKPVKRGYPGLPNQFVLYVGDVNYNKNLPLLVQSCLQIKQPLVIVGKAAVNEDFDKQHPENQDLLKLQTLAKANPGRIILLGSVAAKDLPAIYSAATVYAQPSLAEGFGLPVLEAMACGTPVVTSKGTATEEIAGQAALLINPKDKKELAKALSRCFSNQALRQRLSQLGLKQVKHFSWEKTARETIKVYETIGKIS